MLHWPKHPVFWHGNAADLLNSHGQSNIRLYSRDQSEVDLQRMVGSSRDTINREEMLTAHNRMMQRQPAMMSAGTALNKRVSV
jgi:hypothetical protein